MSTKDAILALLSDGKPHRLTDLARTAPSITNCAARKAALAMADTGEIVRLAHGVYGLPGVKVPASGLPKRTRWALTLNDRVIELLRDQPLMTVDEIAPALSESLPSVEAALKRLRRGGEVEPGGLRRPAGCTRRRVAWRIPKPASDHIRPDAAAAWLWNPVMA